MKENLIFEPKWWKIEVWDHQKWDPLGLAHQKPLFWHFLYSLGGFLVVFWDGGVPQKMDNIWYAFLAPIRLTKGTKEGFPMVIDALEPLTHTSNWSRNRWLGFIANLGYGLPYATEVLFGGVLTGIRGIGEVGVFGSKPLKNRLKRGGGGY